MQPLYLYSTAGCHLCDTAAGLVESAPAGSAFSLTIVDIVYDEQLVARYGESIPVLYRPDLELELYWPFDLDMLQQFLTTRQ